MEELSADNTSSVTVSSNEVSFDAKGRATINNSEANVFIRDTLNASGAIEILAPGRLSASTNIALCGNGNNGYCPPKVA